jgi:hypothetical protein
VRLRGIFVGTLIASLVVVSPARAEESVSYPDDFLVPVMSVSRARSLTRLETARIRSAAESVGAQGFALRFPTLGLTAHTRDGEDLMRLSNKWRIPMATMVAPVEYISIVGGQQMADVIAAGQVAISEKAAELRQAEVGDVLVLRDARFRMREFVIGAIVAEPFVNWGDLLMSSDVATTLGSMPVARVSIVNFETPKAVLTALGKKKTPVGNTFRLRTTWDNENPDGTLGLAAAKTLMGEFAFRPSAGSNIEIAPSWKDTNIAWKTVFKSVPLFMNCHKKVVSAIQGALTEITKAGLAQHIDVKNSNRYGGCFVSRYNRLAGNFGSPSRHAFGMAFDLNISDNQQGTIPQMNCDVVRIMRKWGFAWGGNFWPLDGMHFEYVGERRDKMGFASRYCPNKVPVPATRAPIASAS